MECRLVAIAKNERRYLPEWLAYHLGIGFSRITIYDNDSDDGTEDTITLLSKILPVECVRWPSIDRISPQRSAYNHALASPHHDGFIFFIDVDEFVVPWGYDGIQEVISRIPEDVSSVVVNWRCFGSSGVDNPNYQHVIKRFFNCSPDNSPNNKHIKSLVRPAHVKEMFIHHAQLYKGRTVGPDFLDVVFESDGKVQYPNYHGLQINHYQTKTFSEFSARMARGNANFPPSHHAHTRDGSLERFKQLDINTHHDRHISKFYPQFDEMMKYVDTVLSA